GNDLMISGTYERSREDRRTHYSEFTQASFSRTITLPQEINVDQVTAPGVEHPVPERRPGPEAEPQRRAARDAERERREG
ncbi:MAG TPA: Hsp20/alpha crystallin family protein, partial [Candidatus Acidoferrum sp.]|nr:Hsp20/alpha crystallin family protein [Candidatus Acidoferrum sp.]